MATKITKAQNFNAIREILVNANKPELVAFVDHELELIANKAAKRSSTPTKAQVANAAFKDEILAVLVDSGEPMTIVDLKATNPEWAEYTPQKFSAQLNKLVKELVVEREIVNHKTFYKAV